MYLCKTSQMPLEMETKKQNEVVKSLLICGKEQEWTEKEEEKKKKRNLWEGKVEVWLGKERGRPCLRLSFISITFINLIHITNG